MNKKTHEHGGTTSVIMIYPLILIQIEQLEFDSALYRLVFLMLCTVLMFTGARYGLIYPDLDHQNPKSLPVRNVITKSINKALKAIGATHRSYHTHTIDINTLIFGSLAYISYTNIQGETSVDYIWFLSYVFLLAFTVSACMHVFLDLFTAGGGYPSIIIMYLIYITLKKVNKKIKISDLKIVLAPKWLKYPTFAKDDKGRSRFMLKPVYEKYTTSSVYEEDFRNMLKILNYVFFAISVILLLRYIY